MLQDRQILNATINRTYGGDVRQESIGVFAQGEFYASDQLSFTLGGRYTNENKRATIYLQPTNNNSACNFAAKSCRSEEHTSELKSLMRISYAVFCLTKKKK